MVGAWIVVAPPDHATVIPGCTPSSTVTCVASVDGDLTAFATAVVASGVVALLAALLGIRFSKVTAGGVSVESDAFKELAAGLPVAVPGQGPTPESPEATPSDSAELREAIAQGDAAVNTPPFESLTPTQLNDLRTAVYARHDGVFLAHVLSETTAPGQEYRVALFLVRHRRSTSNDPIVGATFFLGESWRSRSFPAHEGRDHRWGIVVEAFGAGFLALCEVRFASGRRIVIDHYVDSSQLDLVGRSDD